MCIPAADGLRGSVLEELHATPLGGHFGRDKTMALALRRPAAVDHLVNQQRVKSQ